MKSIHRKRRGRSVQDLLGIRSFSQYGLLTSKGEIIFYQVAPTNISVLSHTNIEIKIRHLLMVLSAIPDLEMICTDSCECFDDNKSYLQARMETEANAAVKKVIGNDLDFLDQIQIEMSTARQFFFLARMKQNKPEQVFQAVNRIEKIISEQGFEVRRLKKEEIKRFLAIAFEASMDGDRMPDADGENSLNLEIENEE